MALHCQYRTVVVTTVKVGVVTKSRILGKELLLVVKD